MGHERRRRRPRGRPGSPDLPVLQRRPVPWHQRWRSRRDKSGWHPGRRSDRLSARQQRRRQHLTVSLPHRSHGGGWELRPAPGLGGPCLLGIPGRRALQPHGVWLLPGLARHADLHVRPCQPDDWRGWRHRAGGGRRCRLDRGGRPLPTHRSARVCRAARLPYR